MSKISNTSFALKRHPWRVFFDCSATSTPTSFKDAMDRIKQNLNHFRINYVMVMLVAIFLSLIYHPISMIVFLIVFVVWFFVYLYRDGRGNHVVEISLGLVTVFALVLTGVGMNVVVSLVIVVVVVGLHAVFKSPDYLFLDEEEAVDGGLVSVVASV